MYDNNSTKDTEGKTKELFYKVKDNFNTHQTTKKKIKNTITNKQMRDHLNFKKKIQEHTVFSLFFLFSCLLIHIASISTPAYLANICSSLQNQTN